jgi:hypothetical protein
LPTANEPAEIIEPAIQSLMDANFPKSQMIIVLGTEERENQKTVCPKWNICRKNSKVFFAISS